MSKLPITRDLQGNVITKMDLPPPDTIRWVAGKKYIVVKAIIDGVVTEEYVMERYSMTKKEIESWYKALRTRNFEGLKTTHSQEVRGIKIRKGKGRGKKEKGQP